MPDDLQNITRRSGLHHAGLRLHAGFSGAAQPAGLQPALTVGERQELEYLRRRVSMLEANLSGAHSSRAAPRNSARISNSSRRAAKVQRMMATLPTGEPGVGSDVEAWRAMEAPSIAGLLEQHSDPLRALGTGQIPAIILRGAMSSSEAAAISQRLLRSASTNEPNELGLFERPGDRKKLAANKLQFGAYGVMMSRNMGLKPPQVAEQAARFRRQFEQHNLMHPIATLRRTLEALSVGRRVGVGVDRATNASLSVGGAYRMHFNNVTFPLHFDSLHAKEMITNGGCRAGRKYHWASTARGRQTEAFSDLHRFPQQFAALISLQRSEREGAEVSVFNLHKDDISHACSVPLFITQHNVVLEAIEATNFHVHEHNKGWHAKYGYNVRDMKRWREQLRIDQRARPLHLNPGDLYIFDANRVHTVHRVFGDLKRLSLGSFVGFNQHELRIWS